ncbi:MAG: RIP metalloprotease RseP [Bacteroidales bacterium]|nr:RIP metalloprotease RseP [Bacteroidales bacterium]
MEIAVRIGQLLMSLSLLVICHEFGHFIFAKIFKTKVEKFYLFFDPWFSIFKFKKGETEYGIGWLPLGGYVKIAGMIDESMDVEQMKNDPQPWEFRSKPAWQRLIIMIAGVAVNVILAMMIYAMMAFHWGSDYLPVENCVYGIQVDSLGKEIGLENGDKILEVNETKIEDFSKVFVNLLLNDPKTITVDRNGEHKTFTLSDSLIAKLLNMETPCILPRFPFQIGDFAEESEAKLAGFEVGDLIVAIDSSECKFYDEVKDKLEENKGKTSIFTILRGENKDTTLISFNIPENGKMGVYTYSYADFLEYKHIEYGFFESFPAGISKGIDKINEYCKQWKLIFNPNTKAYKSVGSFISMAKIFPGTWDWYSFWNLTALFSIMLAVINIIPIPGLDGGHVMFLLYEIIVGKKPSDKFMEYAQMAGMIFLILIMILAIGNDFIRHVFN